MWNLLHIKHKHSHACHNTILYMCNALKIQRLIKKLHDKTQTYFLENIILEFDIIGKV